MHRLYKKNELLFSLLWIGIYVVVSGLMDNASTALGVEKLLSAPFSAILAVFLLCWIHRHGLCEKYGLRKFEGNWNNYLYFIPLILIASCNLWRGFQVNLSGVETALYVLSMLCVGFIEEIIFRGFLFKAIGKDNVKQAILIASVTFGMGHIVNLLNGAEILPTLLQIVYAIAIGFLLTIILYKGKSLWPCILAHSAFNALSAFAVEPSPTARLLTAAVLSALSIGYALWLLKKEE